MLIEVTQLLKEKEVAKGAGIIRDGGLVAFRTETVYGLGADATNAAAVRKIFTAKARPTDNPLIVHFANVRMVKKYFPDMDAVTRDVFRRVKHGLTIVMPKPSGVQEIASEALGGHETVAVRIPAEGFARKFIKSCGVPLVAPSANTSTRPSPTRWQDVYDDLNKRIDAIFIGKQTRMGLESTVVRIVEYIAEVVKGGENVQETRHRLEVLRRGAVSVELLEKKTKMPVEVITEVAKKKNSPGNKYKHYAPACQLFVAPLCRDMVDMVKAFAADKNAVVICHDRNLKRYAEIPVVGYGKNAKTIAAKLFATIREAERMVSGDTNEIDLAAAKQQVIIVEDVPNKGEYASIRERLGKASMGQVVS